ncbi:MAG: hypothetical protein FJ014_09530 [Chloroflexi bacterium]|nr:hypothetical protein [Chloroflexota bacterium]
MVEQLQQEIQAYELTRISQSIHTLRDELQGIEAAKLPAVIQKTLDVLEEVTRVLSKGWRKGEWIGEDQLQNGPMAGIIRLS